MKYYLLNIEDIEYNSINAIDEYSEELKSLFKNNSNEFKIKNYLKYYQLPRKVLLIKYNETDLDYNEYLTGYTIRIDNNLMEEKNDKIIKKYINEITFNNCIGLYELMRSYTDSCIENKNFKIVKR